MFHIENYNKYNKYPYALQPHLRNVNILPYLLKGFLRNKMLQIQLRPLILLVQTPEKVVYTFPIQKLYIYYIYVCIHKHTEHFFKNHKNCNILNMLSLNTIFKIYPFLFNVDEIAYYCSIWYSNYTNVFHVFH